MADAESPPIPIEGTHRATVPRWLFRLWCLLVALFAAQAALTDSLMIRLTHSIASGLGILMLVTLRYKGPRTDVSPQGLRVHENFRVKKVEWDEVQAIRPPGRWDQRREVRVELKSGVSLPVTGMPADRWAQELEEYWRSHRTTFTESD